MNNNLVPPEGCICASFWTVREKHKTACPLADSSKTPMNRSQEKLCIACGEELRAQHLLVTDTYYLSCKNSGGAGRLPCARYGLVTTVALIVLSQTTTEIISV